MLLDTRIIFLLLFGILYVNVSTGQCYKYNSTGIIQRGNGSHNSTFHSYIIDKGIQIFRAQFTKLSGNLILCIWILFVSVARIIFYRYTWLIDNVPESCLTLILGIVAGFFLKSVGAFENNWLVLSLNSDFFFKFLLPVVVFEAGYASDFTFVFLNIGTASFYAIIGTIMNTFLVGASIYGVAYTATVNISLYESLQFGALISSVDPAILLSAFRGIHTNDGRYIENDTTSGWSRE